MEEDRRRLREGTETVHLDGSLGSVRHRSVMGVPPEAVDGEGVVVAIPDDLPRTGG